ncbi:MAG: phosphoribosylamine--glycine ligase [Myxococcota bacterium]
MKVLVVGHGGREHALGWRLAQSPQCTELYATRPNAGLAEIAHSVDLASDDVDGLVDFAKSEGIGLTVIGPEKPLTLGIVDAFEANGLLAWGPREAAAQLEGSKAFAKSMMNDAGIATAAYGVFQDLAKAKAWVREFGKPVAVKADGLAAGKGVVLCDSVDEAEAALDEMLAGGAFGGAGRTVVVEELLYGEELSFIALCDGTNVLPLASSQDHKRIGDGDTGPNTGGMGAYSPAPVATPEVEAQVMSEVMVPAVRAMADAGIPFIGFLYAGIMMTEAGPYVLEFNVRLGDPETQPLMARMKSDLVEVLLAGIDRRLDEITLDWDARSALCVVMASAGYPTTSSKGDRIVGLTGEHDDAVVFHAGTTRTEAGDVVTAGGRVLGVTALGDTLGDAAARAYARVDSISWEGEQHRRDIGWRAL